MAKNKRILIVGQHYWPETFRITDIAEGLVERGYTVDVLCGTPNYPTGTFFPGYGFFKKKFEIHNGVRIIRVPEIPRGNNTTFRIFLNYISFPFFSLFYIPALLFNKYDRILAYQLSPVSMSLPAIIISKIKRTPLYFYVCDFWPHSLFSIIKIKNPLLIAVITKFSYWHYKRADGMIGVFKGMQQKFVTEVGIEREKTLYIPQAPEKIYEKKVFDATLNKRFKNHFNIVFAGNINPAQSFETILSAAKLVKDAGHTNIKYIIIGGGMSFNWLKDKVQEMKLEDAFVFEGVKPVEDIPKYQSIADATIVALTKSPLFEYGIPAKVYSYLPAGIPVLGAMDGEGQRLINDASRCGICVDSGDSTNLSKAIIKLLNMTPDERAAMGKRGKKYYLKNFEREKNLDRLIEFVFNNKRVLDEEYDD